MFDLQQLGESMSSGETHSIIRLGVVTAVGAGPPVIVTIGGRPMPVLATYVTPTVNDVVVWLDHENRAVALGPLQ